MNEHANRLSGKVAIVTGGTGGIGKATCHALAALGSKIVIVDKSLQRIHAAEQELRTQWQADTLALALDVSSESDMQEMARLTVEHFGRIDILTTCAGILRAPGSLPKPMANVSVEEWDIVLDINLKGVFLSNRAVLPAMIAQRGGTIINVSSTSGRQGKAHDAPYCASKFGVMGLTESLAEEVRAYGIRVQSVLPDAVDTPLWEQNGPIKPEHALAPERVGELIAFMAGLPEDTLIVAPVIAPFKGRRRRARTPTVAADTSAELTS